MKLLNEHISVCGRTGIRVLMFQLMRRKHALPFSGSVLPYESISSFIWEKFVTSCVMLCTQKLESSGSVIFLEVRLGGK